MASHQQWLLGPQERSGAPADLKLMPSGLPHAQEDRAVLSSVPAAAVGEADGVGDGVEEAAQRAAPEGLRQAVVQRHLPPAAPRGGVGRVGGGHARGAARGGRNGRGLAGTCVCSKYAAATAARLMPCTRP